MENLHLTDKGYSIGKSYNKNPVIIHLIRGEKKSGTGHRRKLPIWMNMEQGIHHLLYY